jgi:hypothetical protein
MPHIAHSSGGGGSGGGGGSDAAAITVPHTSMWHVLSELHAAAAEVNACPRLFRRREAEPLHACIGGGKAGVLVGNMMGLECMSGCRTLLQRSPELGSLPCY